MGAGVFTRHPPCSAIANAVTLPIGPGGPPPWQAAHNTDSVCDRLNMSFLNEGLKLLVWQLSWQHASAPAVVLALGFYAALLWLAWVITRALLDVHWHWPRWARERFLWLGLVSFIGLGAALGSLANHWHLYDYDEPLMILGAGLGGLAFQSLCWRWLRHRPTR